MTDELDDDEYDELESDLDGFMAIAADAASESTDRLEACVAVRHEEPEIGRDLLLAFSISLDADDEDRLSAIQRLLKMDGPAVAAISWLMWQTDWGHLDGAYQAEAGSIVPGYQQIEDDLAAGLSLIVSNVYLDALYRVWAGAYCVIEWTSGSFVDLRALFKDAEIVGALDEVARRHGQTHTGVLIGETSLTWIVDDATLPVVMRFRAADELFLLDKRAGADAFEKIAGDQALSRSQRLRAAEELGRIDPDRGAKIRREI